MSRSFPKSRTGVTGIVLAGGRSSRMGADKRALVFEGRPLLATAVDLLAGSCDDVVVCCRRDDPPERGLLAGRRFELAFDRVGEAAEPRERGMGPLAGLEAGLSAARHERSIVIPVDMPRLTAGPLSRLIAAAERHPGAQAVLFELPWTPAPFPGLYRKAMLPLVSEQLDAGHLKVADLLARLDIVRIDAGGNLEAFANLNDPADLSAFPDLR